MKCKKCGKELCGKFYSNCETCTEDATQNDCSETACYSARHIKPKAWAIIAIILLITTALFISTGVNIIHAIGVMSFLGATIYFIGIIIAAKKHKPKKAFVVSMVVCLLSVIAMLQLDAPVSIATDDTQSNAPQTEEFSAIEKQEKTEKNNSKNTQSEVETIISKFANDNSISEELALSIEKGLVAMGYTLEDADNFRSTDDWANGKRYKFDIDYEQTYVVYCIGNAVESINANGNMVYTG
ncbi:MAG: hypothetical protein RR234_10085 [Christensenella sp.]